MTDSIIETIMLIVVAVWQWGGALLARAECKRLERQNRV